MFVTLLSLALAAAPESPIPPQTRIVSLGGAVTETVCALGRCSAIVGTDASSTAPDEVKPRATLGFHRQISAEGVLSLRPDVVLTTVDSGPPQAIETIRKAGVRVIQVPGESSAEGARERIRFLGEVLDASDRAAALLDKLETDLSAARTAAGDRRAPRVLFIYARGGGTMMVAGRATAAAELIGLAGGVNAVDGYEGYKPLTAEAVVIARPDVVLLTTGGLDAMGGVRALWQAPGLAQTPAGKARRSIAIDDLLLLGFGPRLGQAVLEVAAAMFPAETR